MSRRSSGMEVFDGVRFVRLRSIRRQGKYLAADVDGINVLLSGQRNTHNTVWSVDPAPGPEGHGPCVRLRSAYGRYLYATSDPAGIGPEGSVEVLQVLKDVENLPLGMLWNVVGRGGGYIVRTCSGRYLRGNGKYLTFVRQVTAAADNASRMMLWVIEPVPVKTRPPNILLDPRQLLTLKNRPPLYEEQVVREIRYLQPMEDGSINEQEWETFWFRNNNLLQLRLTLGTKYGRAFRCTEFGLCIRAGRYGRLTPLLIDLPVGHDTLDIVVVPHDTEVSDELRFPDLDAPYAP